MAHSNIDIVDKDYEQCIGKALPRQIRFKSSSYDSIFSQFKKKLYERKMNRVIDKTLSTTYTEKDLEDKLSVNSDKIATLENKIRKLSKDDVPSKYVKSRAIKLRDYMMENTLKNSAGLYLVDLTKDDIVNFNDDLSPVAIDDTFNQIDVDSDNINKEQIGNIINEEFKSLEDHSDNSMTKFVSPEEVRDAVGINPSVNQTIDFNENNGKDSNISNLNSINEEIEDPVIDVVVDTKKEEPNSDKFKPLIFDNPVVDSDSSHDDSLSIFDQDADDKNKKVEIDTEDIRTEIDNALKSMRVSSSESSVAKIDKFDNHGNIRFKDSYTPMTDDEIAKSQEKINSIPNYVEKPYTLPSGSIFDEKVSFENLFIPADVSNFNIKTDKSEEKRDVPVVVTAREETPQNTEDNIVDYTFEEDSSDLSQESDKMRSIKTNGGNTLEEINILKAKALELQKKQKEIDKRMADAQKSAVEKSKEAQAAKESADASLDELNGRLEMFRQYCAGLEKDYDEKVRETEIFQNDIQMNNNFIQIQNSKTSENFGIIDEIDRIMSGSQGKRSK